MSWHGVRKKDYDFVEINERDLPFYWEQYNVHEELECDKASIRPNDMRVNWWCP